MCFGYTTKKKNAKLNKVNADKSTIIKNYLGRQKTVLLNMSNWNLAHNINFYSYLFINYFYKIPLKVSLLDTKISLSLKKM